MKEEKRTSKIESPLMTRHEAAQYLNIAIRTFDHQLALKNIPMVRIGRSVRIRKEALDHFIEAMESRGKRKVVKKEVKS